MTVFHYSGICDEEELLRALDKSKDHSGTPNLDRAIELLLGRYLSEIYFYLYLSPDDTMCFHRMITIFLTDRD